MDKLVSVLILQAECTIKCLDSKIRGLIIRKINKILIVLLMIMKDSKTIIKRQIESRRELLN